MRDFLWGYVMGVLIAGGLTYLMLADDTCGAYVAAFNQIPSLITTAVVAQK